MRVRKKQREDRIRKETEEFDRKLGPAIDEMWAKKRIELLVEKGITIVILRWLEKEKAYSMGLNEDSDEV